MEPVWVMNTRQINIMSKQIFDQNARLNELHQNLVVLGSQLQQTQMLLNRVNDRVPSFNKVTRVLTTIVKKVNQVITRMRAPIEVAEIALPLDDFVAIDIELALNELVLPEGAKLCECDWNLLCDECLV